MTFFEKTATICLSISVKLEGFVFICFARNVDGLKLMIHTLPDVQTPSLSLAFFLHR